MERATEPVLIAVGGTKERKAGRVEVRKERQFAGLGLHLSEPGTFYSTTIPVQFGF